MQDLISRQAAIRWVKTECNPYGKPTLDFESGKKVIEHLEQMPSADRQTDEEDQLKFYYVESIDDYWIGMRIDNFYYAEWCEGLGFVWTHSRYLPWGEHIADEKTLWKEHTYPSEPAEMPFTDWIVGFVKKYFADRPQGEWVDAEIPLESGDTMPIQVCNLCKTFYPLAYTGGGHRFCPNCGARMKGADDEYDK